VTEYAYDALGNLTGITDADGNTTSYGYDPDGRIASEITPSGTTRTGYDARGNAVSVTDPAGRQTSYQFDAANRLTATTDPDGRTWQLSYDPAGHIIASTNPAGGTVKQSWTSAGQLAAVTDPLGRTTSYVRDPRGQVTTVADPAGGTTRYAFDQNGRPTSVTTPAGLATSTQYDAAGRVTAATDARGWITRTVYDARGDTTAVIAPSGAVTRYVYDPARQLTQVTDGNGSSTQYTRDEAGRLVAVFDAKGDTCRYAYDNVGNLISATDALGRTTRGTYDAAGNLIAVTNPAGQTQHLAYDADRRLITRTGTDGSTISYTYDAAGQCTSVTDLTGTTHYTYDGTGHLVTVTSPDGSVLTAGYDAAGQRTSLTYPSGLQLSYRYDLNGRLIGLHDPRAGDAAYALDPDGRLLTEQLPGRLARRYHYEAGLLRRFLTIRDGHPIAETTFTHDPDGRIASLRQRDEVTEYRYDAAGQLVSAIRPGAPAHAQTHFTYDTVGNRTLTRHGDVETHCRYDAASQLAAAETRGSRSEFRYDSSGRLTEEVTGQQRRLLEYDGFGRLAVVTHHGAGRSERTEITYNGNGLISSLVRSAADERHLDDKRASVRYLWSAGDQVPQILSQHAEPAIDDAEHDRPGPLDADFAYGYGRTFASWKDGAAVFDTDAFGSALRDHDTGPWALAPGYDAFGTPIGADSAGRSPAADDEPELPKFGYRGELARGPMVYLRARSYDSRLGRFTSPDPLLVPVKPGQPANPYSYAGNDPLNSTDPSGLRPLPQQSSGPATALESAANAARAVAAAAAAAAAVSAAVGDAMRTIEAALREVQPRGRTGLTFSTRQLSLPSLPVVGQFGVELAQLNLYLNNAQTNEVANDLQLGDTTGAFLGLGFAGAGHYAAGQIAKSLGSDAAKAAAEAAGEAMELGVAALVVAWAYGEYMKQVNARGGNNGVILHFFIWRAWHRSPIPLLDTMIPLFHMSITSWGPWEPGGIPVTVLGVPVFHVPTPYVTAQ
jgi:RHS repeat-associated protein